MNRKGISQSSSMVAKEEEYIFPRSALQKILESVQRGNCCLVLGPRYRGKSQLVRNAAKELVKTGFFQAAYISMGDINQANSRQFYQYLYRAILDQLVTPVALSTRRVVYSSSDFQIAMLDVIANIEHNLVLQIDNLELAPPNLIALLLGSIRSLFTTVANQPGSRFQAIVSGTVNLHQLALPGVSRFESISDLIVVDDMDFEEGRAYLLTLLSKTGIQSSSKSIDAFLEQTNSDRVLIKLMTSICIEEIEKQKGRVLTPDVITKAVDIILRSKPNFEVGESLSQIEGDPELLSCFLEIVHKGEMPVYELPLRTVDNPNVLDLCGVFHRSDQGYKIKSPLWFSILEKHFSSARCGRLYAIAGYWGKAIEYYGKAIHTDKVDKISDLFAATINGMYASEDDQDAVRFLALGLHACYPNRKLAIHIRNESALRLEHFFPGESGRDDTLGEEIKLEERSSAEVEALSGPDYSIVFQEQEARFLLPLRVHSGAHAIGLISYYDGHSKRDQNEMRDEILQMISFVHQATRAIESRRNYSVALHDAKTHSRTLENLDYVLTSVLNHLDVDEEVIFRLLLAGLTANECLGFNRAALILFDVSEKELVGSMGVGHLTSTDADFDWRNFPHHSLDDLMAALMVPDYQYSPLHSKVKSMRLPLGQAGLLAKVYREGVAYQSKLLIPSKIDVLPFSFLEAIDPAEEFAVAPLTEGARRLGLIYVDNKFTHRRIDDFMMASLTSFLTQAALVMEMARSLRVERQQREILVRLLDVERTVNNKITQSIQSVLDEIARSAWELISADSTVAFSLKRTNQEQEGYFEVERSARAHTRAPLIGKPNSQEGMLKWVLANGKVHIEDVYAAPPFKDGYHPEQSNFLKKEGVRSFIGVRLGSKEQPEGVLFINWYSPHSLSNDELTILEVFATFAATAMPSARRHEQLRQDLQKRTQELQALSNLLEASLDSRPEVELANLVQETLESLHDLTRAPVLRLIVLESGDRLREYWLARGNRLISKVVTKLKNGPVSTALNSGQVIIEKFSPTRSKQWGSDWLSRNSRVRMALPLLKGKNRLGAFYIETPEADFFSSGEDEREIIHYLADRLAITYHQTEIYNSLRRLLDIAIKLKPDFELKQVIRDLVEGALQAMPSLSTVTAYFMNRQTGQLELGHAVGVRSKDRVRRYTLTPGSIVDRLLKRGGPIFVEFTEQDPDLHSPFAIREGIRSTAALPLEVGQEMVGYIFFNFRRRYFFDETKQGWLRLFAQLAALAIHRTNLQIDVARRQSRLEAVARITPLIVGAKPDITDVYRTVLQETMKAIPKAHNVCVVERHGSLQVKPPGYYRLILKPPSHEFYHATRTSTIDGYEMGKARKRGIASRVIENGIAEIIPDVREDAAYFRAISSTRSEMCIPIPAVEQAIVLESNLLDAFTLEDLSLVEMLAIHLAVALNNERQFRTQGERQTRETVAQMATGIIHDVNNLISNIPDVVDELRRELRGARDDESIEAYLRDLQNFADSTYRISSKLRDFVIGREFKPVEAELGSLLRKVISEVSTSKPTHVKIEYSQHKPLPKIKIDPLWVEQLFSNLIYNAFEAIPLARNGRVRVNAWLEQKNIRVVIHDNGIGITKDLWETIFQPGFTTKKGPMRLHGIGLYFSQQVVLAHHGEIKVESKPGFETTFTVTFPVDLTFKEDSSHGY